MARLVGDRFRLFELADQRVLLGARFQRRERGGMQAVGEKGEIAFGGDREGRQQIIVELAADNEVERDRDRDRHGGGKGCDRQVRRQHARHCDHEQHQEHHQRAGEGAQRRVGQDRHPAESVEQVQQHEARAPFPGRGQRRWLREEADAGAHDRKVDADHADGPGGGRERLHPDAEQKARSDHEQHHDERCRHPGLRVLAQQFLVESRPGSA